MLTAHNPQAVLNNLFVLQVFILTTSASASAGIAIFMTRGLTSQLGRLHHAMGTFNRAQADRQLPALKVGIRVAAGPLIAGNVGGSERIEYTVIGDTVDLASRLENKTKEVASGIMLSEQTYVQALEHMEIETDLLPAMAVKGKQEPVAVYALRHRVVGRLFHPHPTEGLGFLECGLGPPCDPLYNALHPCGPVRGSPRKHIPPTALRRETMAYRLGYSTLRWKNPDLEPALEELNEAGWDGWEARLPLNWMGTPQRMRRICENTGMPLVVLTANGTPDRRDYENVELNKRRMEYAAEIGADCFMFMNGQKPEGRKVSDDDIVAAAEGADEWAEYAGAMGLELSYHIHTNLLVDSIEDWRTYMAHLNKARLCIDVSHAQLWGYDPVESIRDFRHQLNYVHLQDYTSTARREDGFYMPVWCQVGAAENVDFPAVRAALDEIGYERWVTACPGQPVPGADDPLSEARRSGAMVEYLRGIGY